VDRSPDGIEEGCRTSRDVRLRGQRLHVLDRHRIQYAIVLMIEQDERESSLARQLLLLIEEGVEPSNRIVLNGCHRTGSVDDANDFRELVVHGTLQVVRGTYASHPLQLCCSSASSLNHDCKNTRCSGCA